VDRSRVRCQTALLVFVALVCRNGDYATRTLEILADASPARGQDFRGDIRDRRLRSKRAMRYVAPSDLSMLRRTAIWSEYCYEIRSLPFETNVIGTGAPRCWTASRRISSVRARS